MREETVNRRITNAIDEIPVKSLRNYLKDRIRFERSKMDKAQPYFKNSYKDATAEFAPDDPSEFEKYDAEALTQRTGDTGEPYEAASESEPVQIHEIRLKNWRQYGGKQTVELEDNDGRLINIIEGQNGAGKSNLLNSITLCFYGKQVHETSTYDDVEKQPFITLSRLEDVDVGESKSGFIEVVLGLSQPEYRFRREFETKKLEDGMFENSLGDLELRRKVKGEWEHTERPSTFLNQVLPARVSDYFLFDGEDLDGFFEKGYSNRVEEAIFDVSHLELLNRAIDHFSKIRRDFENQADDADGEVDKIRSELKEIDKELIENKKQIKDIKSKIKRTKEEIEEIDKRLMDVSDEYVQRRYEEVEEKQSRLKDLEEEREYLQEEIKDILTRLGPIIYAADALVDAMENLKQMAEAGNIPPKIQRRFIDELIEQGKCICGRTVEDHSEEEDHLEQLRKELIDVSEAQLEDSSRVPSLLDIGSEQVELLIEKRKESARIEDKIDELKMDIQDIKHELEAYDIPDVNIDEMEARRKELEANLSELHERRARLQVDIEQLEDEYGDIQDELDEELQKQEKHKEIITQLSLIKLAEDCLRHLRDTILEEIRSRTEANINEYFNQLIWKPEEYNVELAEDYSVRVLDEFGDNKIGSLSAGETQVLALSFMAALSQISGFNAPVVIDTPLGRISSQPKRRIAQNLPKYMENTQLTFLMTDEEYTEEVRDIMKDAVGREYRLVYEDNETTVMPREKVEGMNL